MRFEYAPGATPIDLDEAKGLIPAHLTLQRELNEYEESNILEATAWLFARRRGDPLDERFIHVVHGRMFKAARHPSFLRARVAAPQLAMIGISVESNSQSSSGFVETPQHAQHYRDRRCQSDHQAPHG